MVRVAGLEPASLAHIEISFGGYRESTAYPSLVRFSSTGHSPADFTFVYTRADQTFLYSGTMYPSGVSLKSPNSNGSFSIITRATRLKT